MDVDGPSTSAPAAASGAPAAGVDDRARFVIELEFLQCLANPHYLNWLAQNRYLEDPAFLNYLKYLDYWRRPEYAQYVRYPHCLAMLDLLRSEAFRKAIAIAQVAEEVHTQQFYHWQHYRSNRVREGTAALEGPPAGAGGGGGPAGGQGRQQQQQQQQQRGAAAAGGGAG